MAGGPWYHLHLLLNIFTSFYCTDSQVLCVPAVKYLTETSVILWTKWETDEKYSRSTFTGVNRVMLWNVLYHHCRRNQPWFWRVCCCGAARRMFRSLHMSTSLSSSVCFFSLHLQSNGLPSWCSASLLSAGQIHPCFRDMLRHLSRMRVDNPQQISLIKARRDTDLNIFTAGGGLQKPSAMIFFFFPSLAQLSVRHQKRCLLVYLLLLRCPTWYFCIMSFSHAALMSFKNAETLTLIHIFNHVISLNKRRYD